jgi:polyisoprenoid-binding protein YceI
MRRVRPRFNYGGWVALDNRLAESQSTGVASNPHMALEKWQLDTVHSSVSFSVRHLMISKVHGSFKTWTGTLETDDANLANSKVQVSIDAASIDTREPQRDDDLRSVNFLDVANHPKLTFESTGVQQVNSEHFKVTGNLTIRGVSKSVTLDTEFFGRQKDPWGGERAGFAAKTSIDRKEFGLTFNIPLDGGGFVVGDKVDIALDVEAVKDASMTA